MKATILDRLVGYLNPAAGVERLKARTQMAIAGAWAGGSTTRPQTYGWTPYGGSPDVDMLVDRRFLRNRSRDLQRNNPLARGAINTVVTSSVGTGLALRSRVDADTLGLDPQEASEWQDSVEREFRLWAESPRGCDAEHTLDFYGIQSLAFRSALESGDVFAVLPMVPRAGSIYETKVQLIEADRVTNKGLVADTDELFGGIERDKYGAPVAYHILRKHPGGLFSPSSFIWDVVPAFGRQSGRRNVVHVLDKLRPGQPRGVPFLSPVIEALKQLGDYTDGELRAALVSSLFTVFVKSEAGFGLGPDVTGSQATTPQSTGDLMRMGSGAIVDLAPGEDISTANPGRPNPAFDPFVASMLRQIGAALELPYEVLTKHFASSYSASRAALLEAWRFYRGRREWLAQMFCEPIYEAWLDEAVARGRIDAPGYFDDPAMRAAYLRADWVGDSMGQIDPLKEVQAIERRLGLLLTTYADETTGLTGKDWEDVIERRAQEEKFINANGLRAVLVDAGGTAAPPVDPAGVEQDTMPTSDIGDSVDAPEDMPAEVPAQAPKLGRGKPNKKARGK